MNFQLVHPNILHFLVFAPFVKIWHVLPLHFAACAVTIWRRKTVIQESVVCGMSEGFGPDFITITDEDGNEFELEHLDTLEYNNEVYMAFFPAVSEDAQEGEPADIDLDDEEYGLIIMKVVEEDGEELLSTLDSDEELDLIYNQFMERLFADEEMED